LQPQVDARTFHAAMTEEVTDCFQRGALAEEMHGQGVTKTMRTAKPRRLHAGARRPNIERITNCRGLNRTPRRPNAQEYSSLTSLSGSVAQVGDQGVGDLITEWQGQGCADFGSLYTNHAGSPLNVVKAQTGNLTDTETIGGDQAAWRSLDAL
jgi:hypothetical protein